jgi:hypothetical protein
MKARRLRVLSFFVVVAVFGLLPAGSATGQTSASTFQLPDAGVLRLRLGATDHFKWQPTAGSDVDSVIQGISPSGACGLTPLSGNLVALSATNGSVGFVSDGIGVRGSGEGSGQPCGRVDPGQKLTMQLGSSLGNKAMDFAEIDIEGKFGVTFQVDAFFGSGTTPAKTETYVTGGPDSGPDSGDGDNFRIRFPKAGKLLFTKLTFSVVGSTGALSLEGGADGTQPCDTTDPAECQGSGSLGETLVTSDSLFHLIQYDQLLNCGGTATDGGGTDPASSLFREVNSSGECTAIPIVLDSNVVGSQQFVTLRKDLMGQAAQFTWTVTWTPENSELPVHTTQFDFGAGYQPIQWCLADGADAGTFPDLPPTASTTDDPSAVDPWCLTSQRSDLNAGTGKISVKETYFGFGDPGAKR